MTKILANERLKFWPMITKILVVNERPKIWRMTKILANERLKFWPMITKILVIVY